MYVLEGGGHTEPGIHLIAGRRPKLDWPGGWSRGVRRAVVRATVAPCDSSPGRRRPRVTASVSGPAGPGGGSRARPACAGAALPDPGPGTTPPAADRAPEEQRGARARGGGWRRAQEPRSRQAPPRAPRAGPRPGGRAVPSGQLGKRRGGRSLTRTRIHLAKDPGVQVFPGPHFLLCGKRESRWMASKVPSC